MEESRLCGSIHINIQALHRCEVFKVENVIKVPVHMLIVDGEGKFPDEVLDQAQNICLHLLFWQRRGWP